MSAKTQSFSAFGINYRTRQFTAVEGLEILNAKRDLHPTDMLANTEVEATRDEWESLADGNNINDYVRDKINIIAPVLVLRGIISLVHEYNFKFMEDWQGVKIPRRLVDGAQSATSKNVSPMIAQIIQDGAATLRELEEYYSLFDAFKMFDIIMVKGLNDALSGEAANAKMGRR